MKDITFENVQISASTRGFQLCHADSVVFKNCSSITLPSGKGNAFYQQFDALRLSGINTGTGKSLSCTTDADEIPSSGTEIKCFLSGEKMILAGNCLIDNLAVFNVTAKQLLTFTGIRQYSPEFDMSALKTGLYIIRINTVEGRVLSCKNVKMQ